MTGWILLAGQLGLTELDVRILLIALAPDLDRTFEPLYGYLNDDVSRRRATTGLALDLCGLRHTVPRHGPGSIPRLRWPRWAWQWSRSPRRPFLSRSLRVPDRLIAHLLGDDTLDAALTGGVSTAPGAGAGRAVRRGLPAQARRAAGGRPAHRLSARTPGGRRSRLCRGRAARRLGQEALHFAPDRTAGQEPIAELLREARTP